MTTVRRYVLNLYQAFPWLPYEPDDIIQEAYLCLYEKRSEIYDPSGLKSWLIKIAQNKAFDRSRMYTKQIHFVNDFADIDKAALYVPANDPSKIYDLKLYMQLCEQTIGKENMEVLQSYYIDGRPIKDIAKTAGVSVPVMRMRFHRWKKYCAKIIQSVAWSELLLIMVLII